MEENQNVDNGGTYLQKIAQGCREIENVHGPLGITNPPKETPPAHFGRWYI